MSKKAEGFSLRFVLINTGNISRKVLSKVLRSFVKSFERPQNDCYLYKVIDVRLESTLLERMLGLGTIHCFTGDVTDPDLKLLHIKHAKEIKDYILKQSEQERMKRRTVNMQHLDGNPGMSQMAEKDSCR